MKLDSCLKFNALIVFTTNNRVHSNSFWHVNMGCSGPQSVYLCFLYFVF
ncbi:unnamed protein product [Debaryomyces fabryi]|nr:unnamed protein product [Debaryomyces fabryi]